MQDPLPPLDLSAGPGADKESRGRVVIVGGSTETAGAVALAGEAALRAGAGKVTLVVPAAIAVAISVGFPEARVVEPAGAGELLRAAGVVVFGTGLVDEAAARPLLDALDGLDGVEAPVLVDAGALPLAGTLDAPLIVTPNADEAERCAGLAGAVVVEKGPETTVVEGDRRWRHRADLPGLAVSGSGDVLAGAIAGLAARTGGDRFAAACWGVAAHAGAARAGGAGIGLLARELPAHLPAALAALARLPDGQGSGHG